MHHHTSPVPHLRNHRNYAARFIEIDHLLPIAQCSPSLLPDTTRPEVYHRCGSACYDERLEFHYNNRLIRRLQFMVENVFRDIKVCVFDAYGTLFDFNSAAERWRCTWRQGGRVVGIMA